MGQKKIKRKTPYSRKRFGQHYLTDRSVVEQIVMAADIRSQDHVIEIGPGRGALTEPLLQQGADLTIVELDWDLAGQLKERFQGKKSVRIVKGDILKTDWTDLIKPGRKNKIVANLPYNISSPVFFKITAYRHLLNSAVLMVQKELAARIQHDGRGRKIKDYGILSVIAANTFSVSTICQVAPGCFSPPPRVDSTVIHLIPKAIELKEEDAFFSFVKKAFNNRRKLFISFLQKEYGRIAESLSSDEKIYLAGMRPENLLPGQFLRLYQGKAFLD